MKKLLMHFVRDEDGQDLIEYALVAAIITLATIGFINTMGIDIANMWGNVNSVTRTGAS